MKLKNIFLLLTVVALIVVISVFAGQKPDADTSDSTAKVGATIFPLYDLTRQVAGDDFEVVLMLPPGASPHTFDPQPSLLKNLRGAETVFAIGNGLDDWAESIAESVEASFVVVDQGIALRETTEAEHDDHEEGHEHVDDHDEEREEDSHGHDHGPIDPHYWLAIHNAEQIVMNIGAELSELDPENAADYEARAQAYVAELEALEAELKADVAGLAQREVISLHDAWYYFADEFGLNIVGTFEPSAGQNPTPQYLASLEEKAKEYRVSAIFVEPQLSTSSITAFANDHDLELVVLDPLGGVEGRDSYIALMRYNVAQLQSTLGQ